MSLSATLKRARTMADRLPPPPLTSRFWLTAFERCGAGEMRLAEREPDWARLLAAYRKVFAVANAESEALHEWLSELFLRAHRGVPPCGEAEFAELAAWFRASEHARRLGVHAWATAALPGGVEVSLWGCGRASIGGRGGSAAAASPSGSASCEGREGPRRERS